MVLGWDTQDQRALDTDVETHGLIPQCVLMDFVFPNLKLGIKKKT